MTHDELVTRGYKWLLGTAGCGFALTDGMKSTTHEEPDVIGWRDGVSVLVECKASRSDFLADKNKWHRQDPELGMGGHRYYLCPPGVIQPEDLPERWRLLWAYPGMVKRVVDAKGNCHWGNPPFPERNRDAEIRLMNTALRRMHLRGRLGEVYEGPQTVHVSTAEETAPSKDKVNDAQR